MYPVENVRNNEKWCRRINHTIWLCLAVALIGDLAIIFIEGQRLPGSRLQQNLIRYIAVPYGINTGLALLSTAMHLFFSRRKQFIPLYASQIICISLICSVFAWINRDISSISILFLIPIIFSLIYIKRSILVLTFILNLVIFSVHGFLRGDFERTMAAASISAATMYVIMGAVFCISLLVLLRMRELMQSTAEAANNARRDSLTGLFNHASFYEHLDVFIQRQLHGGPAFSLAVADIDNFKSINDTCGHSLGDEVIMAMVRAINQQIGEDSMAFRYGGEEFALLFPGDAHSCREMMERILEDFRRISGQKFTPPVTASAGVSEYSAKLFSGRREFFASADEALYRAKRSGKDRCHIWEAADKGQGHSEVS
ncbi:GGDEF domain-containing protein [Treponema sp. OttesenSCG-928-L16]|nr:GGDEF domain-containing protein [Treponema sp. OttesenSCG-928-L16]